MAANPDVVEAVIAKATEEGKVVSRMSQPEPRMGAFASRMGSKSFPHSRDLENGDTGARGAFLRRAHMSGGPLVVGLVCALREDGAEAAH